MSELIDTHAHLEEFEELESVLANARHSAMKAIIAVGSNETSNMKILEISCRYPEFVFPALGLHPQELAYTDEKQVTHILDVIEQRIQYTVAIGEIGLDYDKRILRETGKDKQKDILQKLLLLAKRYDKPVSLHSRYAWKDCFYLVQCAGIKHAIFHWFTGSLNVLQEIIGAGYYVSCTPAAEYHEDHQRAIKNTPLEQLLLETDCPVTYGKENRYQSQPSDILRSVKAAALLKGIPETIIAQNTTQNAMKIFNLQIPNHSISHL